MNFLERFIYKKEYEANKLLVGEVSQDLKSSRFLLCLFKGILIFIASYCSVCGLLDSFNIPYNKPVVFAAFLFLSLYVAMLYMNKVAFYVFYIILFLVFTIELARDYLPANSGFQAAMNIIFEEYSDYFALSAIREAQEIVTNRYMTVTIAAIFIGTFNAILLNVTISGYMNAIETMIVTFPYIEIALFIHKVPPAKYIFGLLFVYVCVLFLQLSKHSRMQVKGKHTHEFVRYKKKNENLYAYQADTPVFIHSIIFSFAISLILTIVLSAALNAPISKEPKNAIHKMTQEYVKIFIQSGTSGFLDSYASTGGLSGGRLGGVSQVRPDFETDLNVTFAPIGYDTVYLKGYTGTIYTRSKWATTDYDFKAIEKTREYPFENEGKMKIENIDADARFNYIPYFSDIDDITFDSSTKNNYEVTFKPALSTKDYKRDIEDELISDPDYYDYVYNYCLDVPADVKETIDDTLTEIVIPSDHSDTNEYRLKCANAVYSYFYDNYSYTMAPGSTPKRNDFVEYFLTSQKRGFCAHFASATVLLLRDMGVPARYCEGYMIPIDLIYDDAVLTDYAYDEWYKGDTNLDLKSVVQVPVNDSYAHAWVEIYLEGYGFVPFEATIPSFAEDSAGNLFNWSFLFAALTSNTMDFENGEGTNNAINNLSNFASLDFLNVFDFDGTTVAGVLTLVLIIILLTISLYFIVKFAIIKIRLYIYKKKNDEYHLVMYEYNRLVRSLKRKKFLKKANPLPIDVKEAYDLYIAYYNNTHKKQKDIDTDKLFKYYEKVMYS